MRARIHTHPCADCGTPTECDGTWERNHDGWPAAVCDIYHRRPEDHCCESCRAARREPAADDAA